MSELDLVQMSVLIGDLGGVDHEAQERAAKAQPLTSALYYAKTVGWCVFPLRAGDKTPAYGRAHTDVLEQKLCRAKCGAFGHGLYDATRDPDRIAQMWTAYPDAGIGVPTGLTTNGRGEKIGCGFDVIDVDPPNGPTSFEKVRHSQCQPGCSDEQYCPALGPLPPLLGVTLTPRGGRHYWTQASGGGNSTNDDSNIDLRATGGYVALPPTRRAGGVAYTWLRPPWEAT